MRSTPADEDMTWSVPPGLGEAIGDLSRGLLRSEWHCENIAHADSPVADSYREPSPNTLFNNSTSNTNQAFAAACVVGRRDPSASFCRTLPFSRPEPLTPPRRLEVTLRGTFHSDHLTSGSCEAGDTVEDEQAHGDVQPRAASTSCWNDEDLFRARMGFGRDEAGATPSGRSSVPAIRGVSAPPLAETVDEGIELSSLVHSVEYHIHRILERSLRAPSREESFQNSPRASPSPPPSLCPSPTPRGTTEDLNLRVLLRLCQTRCGSSSAVLELRLDHSPECSEASGCQCLCAPEDAEARLLAYFSRHSMLRLAATRPPVRVVLEPLDSDDV